MPASGGVKDGALCQWRGALASRGWRSSPAQPPPAFAPACFKPLRQARAARPCPQQLTQLPGPPGVGAGAAPAPTPAGWACATAGGAACWGPAAAAAAPLQAGAAPLRPCLTQCQHADPGPLLGAPGLRLQQPGAARQHLQRGGAVGRDNQGLGQVAAGDHHTHLQPEARAAGERQRSAGHPMRRGAAGMGAGCLALPGAAAWRSMAQHGHDSHSRRAQRPGRWEVTPAPRQQRRQVSHLLAGVAG